MKTRLLLAAVAATLLAACSKPTLSTERIMAFKAHLKAEASAVPPKTLEAEYAEARQFMDKDDPDITVIESRKPEVLREWLETFAEKDAEPVIAAFGKLIPKEHRHHFAKRFSEILPSIKIDSVGDHLYGSVDTKTWTITLSPLLLSRSYEAFRETMIHELGHFYVQNQDDEQYKSHLQEGMTDYLAVLVTEACGHAMSKERRVYDNIARAVAFFAAAGAEKELWSWYITRKPGHDELNHLLGTILATIKMEKGEADMFIDILHNQGTRQRSMILRGVSASLDLQMLRLQAEKLAGNARCTADALKTFESFRTQAEDPEWFKDMMDSGNMDGFLREIASETYTLVPELTGGYPEYLNSTVIPAIQRKLGFKPQPPVFGEPRPEDEAVSARIESVCEGKTDARQTFVAILTETVTLLEKDRDRYALERESIDKRLADIRDVGKAIEDENKMIERALGSFIAPLRASHMYGRILNVAPKYYRDNLAAAAE